MPERAERKRGLDGCVGAGVVVGATGAAGADGSQCRVFSVTVTLTSFGKCKTTQLT